MASISFPNQIESIAGQSPLVGQLAPQGRNLLCYENPYPVANHDSFGKPFHPLINHQGIICCVAFDRSSLRRITAYASVVAPRRLTSNTLLVIRNAT
jgi:hypothetical protein